MDDRFPKMIFPPSQFWPSYYMLKNISYSILILLYLPKGNIPPQLSFLYLPKGNITPNILSSIIFRKSIFILKRFPLWRDGNPRFKFHKFSTIFFLVHFCCTYSMLYLAVRPYCTYYLCYLAVYNFSICDYYDLGCYSCFSPNWTTLWLSTTFQIIYIE